MSLWRRFRQAICSHPSTSTGWEFDDAVKVWRKVYWHCFRCGKTWGTDETE